MAISTLPLCYCTNVHPGRSVAEVRDGLERYTVRVRDAADRPLAAGLWLARPVVDELLAVPDGVARFADWMEARGLTCHTLNAFPYGDFHGERVKENVYLPDWSTPERVRYTLDCAAVLARLLETPSVDHQPSSIDPQPTGSISTLPLGFKTLAPRWSTAFRLPDEPTGPPRGRDFLERCLDRLIETAAGLDRLREATGRTIRLAIEPEPLCLLETTDEAITFFASLWSRAEDAPDPRALENVRRHIGLCYDVCHQAVEFEDTAGSIRRLDAAGVHIAKVHITCALRLERPGDDEPARATLAGFAEPRYLHQLTALAESGEILRHVDLTAAFALDPPDEFRAAREWRVHFHVPVDAERIGPLGTTRDDLRGALAAVAELGYAPHLEVETYTWGVLPGERQPDLVEGLGRELRATRELLDAL
ncbi:MAG: metabolite traffic protein EboE [Planctomycetales bacterium]